MSAPPPPQPPVQVQVLDLSAESLAARREHELMLLDLEAKKRAYQVDVPTLVDDVRSALRAMGLPVRLFGENLADVRDRLRMELARREVLKEGGVKVDSALDLMAKKTGEGAAEEEDKGGEEQEVTKYTVAEPELMAAREEIGKFSTKRARARLARERLRRETAKQRGEENSASINVNGKRPLDKKANVVEPDAASAGAGDVNGASAEEEDILTKLDRECLRLYKSVRSMCLEGSQFADARPLSAICTSPPAPGYAMDGRGNRPALIATGGWSGAVRIWDGSLGSSTLDPLATKTQGHEDRIMGIAMAPFLGGIEAKDYEPIVATASIDLTGKLWKVRRNDCVPMPMEEDDDSAAAGKQKKSNGERADPYAIEELATLRGHAARLGRVAFHPSGRYVATTSFDHTWRLWDVETGGTQLLLQDGLWKECYGIGMHPDGSLCATTDFGGTVRASPWRPSWVVSRRRTTSPLLPPHRLTLRGSFGKSDGTIACQCPWRKMMIALLQASRRRVTEKGPIHMQSRSLPPFVDMPLDWVASRSIPPVDMLPPLRSITPGGCGMWKRAELSYFYRMGCGRNATASVCIPMEVFAPPPISEAPSSAGTSGRANRPVTSPVLTPDEFCAPSSRRMVFSWPRRAMTVPSRSGI